MELDAVRELKAAWNERTYSLAADRLVASRVGEEPLRVPERAFGLALGAAVLPQGGYCLAVRYGRGTRGIRELVAEIVRAVGTDDTDVRCLGAVRPLVDAPGAGAAGEAAGAPTGPSVPSRAQPSLDVPRERLRARPVTPGSSVAHVAVSAGTVGGFVAVPGEPRPMLLSNSHVLAESGLAALGDSVVQPGPVDGGDPVSDRIGELAVAVPLPSPRSPGAPTVDVALARVDSGIEVTARYPFGPLAGTAVAAGGEEVVKVGRTTGLSRGRVSAIEVDDVVVDYGPGVGLLRFDGQLEVSGTGTEPFSRGGDSGSLVAGTRDRAALGLLFAGSEFGGAGGQGLTYCNPVDDVLGVLRAELVRQ